MDKLKSSWETSGTDLGDTGGADTKASGQGVSRKVLLDHKAQRAGLSFLEAFPPLVSPLASRSLQWTELMPHQLTDRHSLATGPGTSQQHDCELAEFHG